MVLFEKVLHWVLGIQACPFCGSHRTIERGWKEYGNLRHYCLDCHQENS